MKVQSPEPRTPFDLRMLGLFVGLAVLLFADRLIMGPEAFIRLSDTFDSALAYNGAYARLLKRDGPTAWFPHDAGGRPANAFHFGPLFPVNLLVLYVPLWVIYTSSLILLCALAGYGMWRWLQGYLEVPPDLALLGGVVFSFTSLAQPYQLVVEILNFIFPLFFMLSVVDADPTIGSRVRRFVGLSLICLFSYPVLTLPEFCLVQIAVILLLTSGGYALFKERLLRWCAVWFAYGLLFLPQILTLLAYREHGQRVYQPGTASFLARMDDFGWEVLHKSGLTFFLAGACVLLRVPRVRRAMSILVGVLVVVCLDTSSFGNFYRGTIIADLELRQLLFTVQPLTVCVAFLGLTALADSPGSRRAYVIAGGCALAHLGWINRYNPINPLFMFNVAITALVLFHLAGGWVFPDRWRRPLRIGIFLLLIGVTRVLRFSGYSMEDVPYRAWFGADPGWERIVKTHRDRPGRTATLGFYASAALIRGLETADVLTSIFSQRYKDYWGLIIDAQLESDADRRRWETYYYSACLINGPILAGFDTAAPDLDLELQWPLLEAANVTHLISTRPLDQLAARSRSTWIIPEEQPPDRLLDRAFARVPQGLLDRLSVRPLGDRQHYFSPRPLWVYELEGSFDRGYLVADEVILPGEVDVLRALSSATREDLERRVFLSAADLPLSPATGGTGPDLTGPGISRLESYQADRLVFSVETSRPSLLVVSNTWHPRWQAKIDGRTAPVIRANQCFQAVRLPEPGKHEVVLEFVDPWIGPLHGSIALGLLVLGWVSFRRWSPSPGS